MSGLLNINKPSGMTSRDVVNRVVRLVGRGTKVGHTGTLDPLATGVLVVAVGPATRLVDYSHRLPKQYLGEFQLGCSSDSLDLETEVCHLEHPPRPTRDEIERVLPDFRGQITQQPPAYSAVKIAGREAYKRVRQGEVVDMPTRQVRIDSLHIEAYDYPTLRLDITCGSGTYIRTLGDDIARSLGTRAVMSQLVRTAIGPFPLAESVDLESLGTDNIDSWLRNPIGLLHTMPRIALSELEVEAVSNGRFLPARGEPVDELAAVDREGRLIAIMKPRAGGLLGPALVFN